MPVDGFPEMGVDKKCMRCGKWFHPHEGELIMPDVRGPFSQSRRFRIQMTGDTSKLWFMCFRCQKVRKIRSYIIYGIGGVLFGGFMLLELLGII